jgi:hypothetical protein
LWNSNSRTLAFGGLSLQPNTGATEEYDGSTWAFKSYWFKYSKSIGLAGAGTQTATVAFGGTIQHLYTGATEEYDGSTWTSNPTEV